MISPTQRRLNTAQRIIEKYSKMLEFAALFGGMPKIEACRPMTKRPEIQGSRPCHMVNVAGAAYSHAEQVVEAERNAEAHGEVVRIVSYAHFEVYVHAHHLVDLVGPASQERRGMQRIGLTYCRVKLFAGLLLSI